MVERLGCGELAMAVNEEKYVASTNDSYGAAE
jgi:hypothetical protein